MVMYSLIIVWSLAGGGGEVTHTTRQCVPVRLPDGASISDPTATRETLLEDVSRRFLELDPLVEGGTIRSLRAEMDGCVGYYAQQTYSATQS